MKKRTYSDSRRELYRENETKRRTISDRKKTGIVTKRMTNVYFA